MTQKIRRSIALWLVFLWMSPASAFSDNPTDSLKPTIENEKAALLEMMAFVSELKGSQIPALKVVRDKAEALIERLKSKEDPLRKRDAELIDTKILKPIDALINMGSLLEACGRGEELILSGLGRQFVRAMVERINIGKCRDLQAIATPPEMMMLARNVSQIEEAILSGKPRPKKVDDLELFEKILEKSREMAIVSYFKEYSKLQGEIHFNPLDDRVKVTQESADAYFRITGERIFEPETFKSFFHLSQEKRGVGVALSQIHQARREEFKRSQKSSYEEFIKENREAYRQEVEGALRELSHLRLSKEFQNARWLLSPAARDRIEGVRPSPEQPSVARLEEGERLWLDYLFEKGVDADSLYARDLGYGRPDDPRSRDKFELFLNNALGPQAFSQLDHSLDSELKLIRERAKSYRITLDSDALAQLIQKGLAQVKRVDEEGESIPAWEAAKEELPHLRARYEVLKNNIYRDFMVVRHDPEVQKIWENDEAKPISSDAVSKAWEKYDASMQTFLKETLPTLKAEGEKDPKKQIKLALKYHPSAVLGALLDDPRIEVAKRICELGDEIKVDEVELEKSSLTWGLGATLAVGASAALTYGMGPLFGYGLGFGAYGDAIFSGTATAVGGGHMLFKSIPDYQALAFEGEVMEDILLALGEGDPRDVADKMGEINAQFAGLIGEGFLNAVGGLAFIKAAANLRAEALRRELEAVRRASQNAKAVAQANVQRGLGRDFDASVYNGKSVFHLSDDERIAYAEKSLGYKPGGIKNQDELRQALLDAHAFNEVELGKELLSRRRSLNEFTFDEIRRMIIAGKARRLQPFASQARRELLERGIVGDEAFLKGGSQRELENTLAGLEKGDPETLIGAHPRERVTLLNADFAILPGRSGDALRRSEALHGEVLLKIGNRYKVTHTDGKTFTGTLEGQEEGEKLVLAFRDDQGTLHALGPENMKGITPDTPLQSSQVFPEQPVPSAPLPKPEPPSVPSPAARPPAEVSEVPRPSVPFVSHFPVQRFNIVRYNKPRGLLERILKGRSEPEVVLTLESKPVLFIDNEGFVTPGFVVKPTTGSPETALMTKVSTAPGGKSVVDIDMKNIVNVEQVVAKPQRIYLRGDDPKIAPEVGDVVFYLREEGYRPALVIHKGAPKGGRGREQLVLGYLDPATGNIIELDPWAVRDAISGTNRINTGQIRVPENSPLKTLPEARSPSGGGPAGGNPEKPPSPPDFIIEYNDGKLDVPSVPHSIKMGQKMGDDIIHTSSEKSVTIHTTSGERVTVRKGGIYTVKLGDDEFKGAYVGKIVTNDGKTVHYFDDGTNDMGRAIEEKMILGIN